MRNATAIERHLVLAAKLRPEDPSTNWALLSRLPIGTNPHRFAAAVGFVLNNTRSFTQVFSLTEQGQVAVAPTTVHTAVHVVEYRGLAEVRRAAASLGDSVFDPSVAPLYHAEVATVGDVAYLLFAGAHVCSDGFGFYNLTTDFAARYSDTKYSPAEVPVLDDSSEVYRNERAAAVEHFSAVFGGLDNLQIDGWDRRDFLGRIPGVVTRTSVPVDAYTGAGELARYLGVRRYSVLVAAFALVAGCLASTRMVVVATPMKNRRAGTDSENTRGVRVNTLPLRFDLIPQRTFAELVRDIDRQLTGLINFEQHEFSEFSRSLFRSESMDSTQPSTSFTLYPQPLAVTVGGVQGEPVCVTRRFLQYPLTAAIEVGAGTGGTHADADTINLIVERADYLPQCDVPGLYTHVLRQVLASQGDIGLGAVDWRASPQQSAIVPVRAHFESRTLIDDFLAAVTNDPAKAAIVTDDREITYSELDSLSDAVAQWIRDETDTSMIGVAVGPSLELVATILGLLKAGVIYVPIDGGSPARVAQIAEVCGHLPILVPGGNPQHVAGERVIELPNFISSDPSFGSQGRNRSSRLRDQPGPEDTAYVIFTSGTTGTPKGVRVSHRSAARFFDGLQHSTGIGVRRWLQSHAPTFDISLVEIFGALSSGGTLCISRPDARRDPSYLADFVRRHEIEVVSQTPSAFALLSARLRSSGTVRFVLFCGERLEQAAVAEFANTRTDVALMNCYGITETTMYHTAHRIAGADPCTHSAIGSPFADVSMAVVDEELRIVPLGVSGQLAVGGDGLMQGYFDDNELTARRMAQIDGSLMFLTGDRGTMLANGEFAITGRIDHQVKIRGHRCEPGEIENAVYRTGFARAVHVQVTGTGLTAQMVCFVVLNGTAGINALREAVRRTIPRYFEPDRFVTLDVLPMTRNGKVDTTALQSAALRLDESDRAIRATNTSASAYRLTDPGAEPDRVGDTVRRVWADALGSDDFGPTTNFFDAGGTSALVLQVGQKLRQLLDVDDLDVVDLFEHHTPAALTELLTEKIGRTAR
ncbi:amino acid adenylation domain-containing protein [Rhodococcus fascians]|nr:amino acid adenylation domain-containing protein [Rhodococcus fascians]MBY4058110.1 amino acid adenylation domain-containing protein [Rhodococcus fascians]MBY4069753.1 amino acid adenylation domain-containing protein [Rhodococcus fascians]